MINEKYIFEESSAVVKMLPSTPEMNGKIERFMNPTFEFDSLDSAFIAIEVRRKEFIQKMNDCPINNYREKLIDMGEYELADRFKSYVKA